MNLQWIFECSEVFSARSSARAPWACRARALRFAFPCCVVLVNPIQYAPCHHDAGSDCVMWFTTYHRAHTLDLLFRLVAILFWMIACAVSISMSCDCNHLAGHLSTHPLFATGRNVLRDPLNHGLSDCNFDLNPKGRVLRTIPTCSLASMGAVRFMYDRLYSSHWNFGDSIITAMAQ